MSVVCCDVVLRCVVLFTFVMSDFVWCCVRFSSVVCYPCCGVLCGVVLCCVVLCCIVVLRCALVCVLFFFWCAVFCCCAELCVCMPWLF